VLDLKPYLESYDEKFSFLDDLINGMVNTTYVNTVLVSGPPGIGKTYTVDNNLQKRSEQSENPIRYRRVSGKITPLAFYNCLVENSSFDSVLFFDDADTILSDQISLNLLKEASEKRAQRTISYNSSRGPNSPTTVFDGKIIIATNIQISKSPHYAAVADRFHTFDMDISYREKLAKIHEIAENFTTPLVSRAINNDIVNFLAEKEEELDTDKITIRTFVKLQELAVLMPLKWKRFAEISNTYLEGGKK
jgi:hypothetical protein